MQLNLAHVARN